MCYRFVPRRLFPSLKDILSALKDSPRLSKDFTLAAKRHMEDTGMDTIFYMRGVNKNNPTVPALVVFTYFSRFTKARVEEHIKDRIKDGSFDDHQKLANTRSTTNTPALRLYNVIPNTTELYQTVDA